MRPGPKTRTHCKRGHEFIPATTIVKGNGDRQCRTCHNELQRIGAAERNRRYREKHHDTIRERTRVWQRNWRLRAVYGITPEQYDEMYRAQNGVCALPTCNAPINATDHDHVTGQVRALLCKPHNSALGLFGDNPQLLREAAEYLEHFKEIHNA